MAKKREVNIGSPVMVAGITLTPILEISSSYRHGKRGFAVSGNVRAVGVLITSPSMKRAFRISGEEVTLSQLAREVPDAAEAFGEP